MEVILKNKFIKHFTSLFIVVFSFAFTGLAAAHGDHDGDRHGERIATTWLIADAINTFQVDAPVNPPLRYVKMRVMARTGLPVKHAEHYLVEKMVTTTGTGTYTRDPSCLPTDPCPPILTPVTTSSYVLLDESMSLKELGIVAGDTLRIREMPDHDLSAPHHGDMLGLNDHHDHDRHDHDGHDHR